MTTHDETHITKTSPQRFMKGLIIIIIPLIFLGYITIVYWEETASLPPPVSAPPPAPPPEPVDAPGASTETTSTGVTTAPDAAAPASATGPALSIPAGSATPGNPAYAPDPLTVTQGDVITVTNDDTVPHTVTSGAGPQDPNSGTLFDTSIMMAGDTAQIDTAGLEAGDYAYYCTVHPFMTGTLTVQ
jgi:plastocyanin